MKYTVKLEELVNYFVDVEADSRSEAGTKALDKWNESDNPDQDFRSTGHGVEIVNVRKDEPA